MEQTSKVTPKDFFLWLGVVVALYGSIGAFIALFFEYINRLFPDTLAGYADPYAGGVRFSMAALIVLTPLLLTLVYVIRKSILAEPGKAHIWVRRWALVLTLFIAGATIAIDLITLVTTFLGGEITTRFFLKVAVVLLVAAAVFMHFLADLKGYWLTYPKRAHLVAGAAALAALLSVVAGFFIVGTPTDMRLMRFDAQKESDLQTLQWKVVEYYQQKQSQPESLEVFNDPISSFMVPVDPQSGESYVYRATDTYSFTLCATFNRPSQDLEGRGEFPARDMSYPSPVGIDQNWKHGVGETCFDRTIDPDLYKPFPKAL